jgi:effector-binding domain-containing protein/carbon monoxide dehydrogenase subunit G
MNPPGKLSARWPKTVPGRILYSSAAILLLFVIVGVFLPSSVRVSRETQMDAPAATVFALVSDVTRFREWSPWTAHLAPGEVVVEGSHRGPGATIRWKSQANGEGRLTVADITPSSRIVAELALGGRDAANSAFTVEETGGRTHVLWSFESDLGMNLIARYLRPFSTRRVARDYEKGLADLKSLAETLPRADFSELQIEHVLVESAPIAYVTTSSVPSTTAISEAMGEAFFDVLRFMDRNGLKEVGAPLSITRVFSGSRVVFDAAIPVQGVTEHTPESGDGVRLGTSYGGSALRATHIGSYGDLARTHEKVAAYLAAYGIERNGDAWESYESDPARTAESELVTYVYYPIETL